MHRFEGGTVEAYKNDGLNKTHCAGNIYRKASLDPPVNELARARASISLALEFPSLDFC